MGYSGPPYQTYATLADDPSGDQVISVIAKRTYDINPKGALSYSEEQLELNFEEGYEEKDNLPGSVPVAELDTIPYKLATDLVVFGKAYAPGGRKVSGLKAAVIVGKLGKVIQVFGDRKIEITPNNKLRFTEPKPFESIELTYWNAFGGIDTTVLRDEPKVMLELLEGMPFEMRPGAYPRNPVGTGYVVNEEKKMIDGRPLPNLEDPNNPLSPERVLVRKPELWWRQPMPQSFGWLHQCWYPRATFAGLVPYYPPPDHLDEFPEVKQGLIPKGQSQRLADAPIEEWVDFRLLNGASPGLIMPYLKGDEKITLVGMDANGDVHIVLPGERPEILVRFGKDMLKIETHLHTVCILKEESRLFLVWRGSARTPRLLPDKLPTLDDPMYDMLEGFDIAIDGVVYPHEREPFKQS